jgi:hypothetical protein
MRRTLGRHEVFTLPHVFLEDSWSSYQEDQESSKNLPGIVLQPLFIKWLGTPGKFLEDSWRIPTGFLVKSGNSWSFTRNPQEFIQED